MGRKKQKITDHLDKLGNATSKLKDSGILDAMAEIGDVGELFQVVKEIGSELSKDKKGFKLSDLSKMLFEEDGAGRTKGLSGAEVNLSDPWSSQPKKSHRWVNTEAYDDEGDYNEDSEEDDDYNWEDYSCYEEVPVQLVGGNSDRNQSGKGDLHERRDRHSGIDGKNRNGQGKYVDSEEEARCAFEVYHRDHPLNGSKAGKRKQSQSFGMASNNSGSYPNLEEIIVWSEIIGDPVSVKRRKQRNERRYGYQGYAGRR